jgi:3-oxo-5-alpha-steroid 4-dehydrogenase 1
MILLVEYFLLLVAVWSLLAISVFFWLFFITAPYGRFVRSGWGPTLVGSLNWLLMELPALFVFDCIFLWSEKTDLVSWIFFALWNLHYGYRSLIYPCLMHGSQRVPLTITVSGASFNVVNAGLQSTWLFFLAGDWEETWLLSPAFLIGAILFVLGFMIHIQADHHLRQLRRELGPGYHLPEEGTFRWISCPNYFGELVEWIGWALLTFSWSGVSFALWTAANLIPRALAAHRWYQKQFPDYPRKRKAIVPFLL